MPKKKAPTKATGGGGYTFADKVAAGFLAMMLKRKFPLEPDLGVITELHFETHDVGHPLDDLHLLLKRGTARTRCSVSVKSNRRLTKASFNGEFVEDAWHEWLGGDGSDFDPAKDILGLIVGVIDEPTLQEWRTLQEQAAATTPERLVARLHNDRQSSKSQRAIFDSLRKTASGEADENETARLAARLRVLRFAMEQEGDYVNLCAEITAAGTVEEGQRLWSRLLQLASENRATGGFFDLPKLVHVLRPDFDLKEYPDFQNDWTKIGSITRDNINNVRPVIGPGSGIRLPRMNEISRLTTELEAHSVLVIPGESGSGKSAAVSKLVTEGNVFKQAVWLTSGQLSKASQPELATALSLSHTIPDMIKHSAARASVFVVDGFERLEGEARNRVIELLRAVGEEGFVGWQTIVTCQPQSVESVRDALVAAGITALQQIDFEPPTLQEIREAVGGLPGMGMLLLRGELGPILRNLLVLDWVLRKDVAQRFSSSRPWIGATEIIDSIWDQWTGATTMRHARDSLLRTLAEREGERLSGVVHIDSIATTEQPLLGEFEREGLVQVTPPLIQFAHDLMGDWTRYRILKYAGADAPQKIKSLAHIPRWGRAIRLYAQSLAEHGTGLDDWKAASAHFAGEDAASKLASDLFLDGLLFAANAEVLLEQVWADLIANDGQILHRLLKRLLHVASFPDWRLSAFGDPKWAEQSEAWFRIPQPIYWIPVLRVLSRHTADVAKHALILGAEVCALWLRTMPIEVPGRREAGLLALRLGKETQGLIAEGVYFA
jgi:hypothetical protein